MNEYNIVDKIQSANSLLFASIELDNAMDEIPALNQLENLNTNKSDKLLLQSKHRVTFSSDIEEYGDDVSEVDSTDVQYKDDEAIEMEIAEIIERDEKKPNESGIETHQIDGLIKRLSIDEVFSNDDEDSASDNDYTTELEILEEQFVEEQIVEEQIVQMTNNTKIFEKITKHDETSSVPTDEQDSINKQSKTIGISRQPFNNKINGGLKWKNENSPTCNACNKSTTTSAPSNYRRGGMKRPATAQIHRTKSANTANKEIHQDELLKLHLNVRACCENKYLHNNRLPRYNGYISQYGLSKDQLEMRELNRKKFIENRARREREIMRAKQQIADLNEQAFQQWLIRKNRCARPKYKNMYDVTPPKQPNKFQSHTKFRSSSESHS